MPTFSKLRNRAINTFWGRKEGTEFCSFHIFDKKDEAKNALIGFLRFSLICENKAFWRGEKVIKSKCSYWFLKYLLLNQSQEKVWRSQLPSPLGSTLHVRLLLDCPTSLAWSRTKVKEVEPTMKIKAAQNKHMPVVKILLTIKIKYIIVIIINA